MGLDGLISRQGTKAGSSRNISIFGMGYVGLVTAATFVKKGFNVQCVDVARDRVNLVNSGVSPIFEPGIEAILRKGLSTSRFKATTKARNAVMSSNFIFICVGTPSTEDGSIDLRYVRSVAYQIGKALRGRKDHPVVIMKSTVVPNTCKNILLPLLEKSSGMRAGRDFGLACNPEFLKEGEALNDSLFPDRIVIGGIDEKSCNSVKRLYKGVGAPIIMTDLTTAEMIKYVSNAFLAARVALTNEVANICSANHTDVYEVMRGVGLDRRIGPLFLRAGAGFGGSCFPKDLKALKRTAEKSKVKLKVLPAILEQNEIQPHETVRMVEECLGPLRGKRIALLGLAFKPDTDDVRETRALPILNELIRKGAIVKVFDPIPAAIDNFLRLIRPGQVGKKVIRCNSLEKALAGVSAAILQTEAKEFRSLSPQALKKMMRRPVIIDGRRALDPVKFLKAGIVYRGIGWKNI